MSSFFRLLENFVVGRALGMLPDYSKVDLRFRETPPSPPSEVITQVRIIDAENADDVETVGNLSSRTAGSQPHVRFAVGEGANCETSQTDSIPGHTATHARHGCRWQLMFCYILRDMFVNAIPRGVSQVCFMDNPWVGYGVFIALCLPSPPYYTLLASVGILSSTIAALLFIVASLAPSPSVRTSKVAPFDAATHARPITHLNTNNEQPLVQSLFTTPLYNAWLHGLFGFNGILVGCAVATFTTPLGNSLFDGHIVLTMFGSLIATMLSLCLSQCWSSFRLPTFTMPFNLATLIVLGATIGFSNVNSNGNEQTLLTNPNLLPALPWKTTQLEHANVNATVIAAEVLCFQTGSDQNTAIIADCGAEIVKAVLRGVSQVYFCPDWRSGLALSLLFAVCSPIGALTAVFGSGFGVALGWAFAARAVVIHDGLMGYNAVIAAMSVNGVFFQFGTLSMLLCALTVAVAASIHGMLLRMFQPFGLPVLTLPFCLAALLTLTVGNIYVARIAPGDASIAENTLHCVKQRKAQQENAKPRTPRFKFSKSLALLLR